MHIKSAIWLRAVEYRKRPYQHSDENAEQQQQQQQNNEKIVAKKKKEDERKMKKEEMVTFKRNVVFLFFLRTAKKPRKLRPTAGKEEEKGKEGTQTKSKTTRILVQFTRKYGFSASLFWSGGCCFLFFG